MRQVYGEGLREANRLRWEMLLEKGALQPWKGCRFYRDRPQVGEVEIMLAALLKQKTIAANVWIADHTLSNRQLEALRPKGNLFEIVATH